MNLFWLCRPRVALPGQAVAAGRAALGARRKRAGAAVKTAAARRAAITKASATLQAAHINYEEAARSTIDSHVIKIPLEASQLLYSAHHLHPRLEGWIQSAPLTKSGLRGFKLSHKNNPITLWVCKSVLHYRHTVAYGLALCKEYTHRFGGKVLATEAHLHWLRDNEPLLPVDEFLSPPCAMPEECQLPAPADEALHEVHEFGAHVYDSYRKYYLDKKIGKVKLSTWRQREVPAWVAEAQKLQQQQQQAKAKKKRVAAAAVASSDSDDE
jgi:hypothetical protein